MARIKPTLVRWPLLVAVLTVAVLDSASGDSTTDSTADELPAVFIEAPSDLSILRSPSFEISGDLAGTVTTIDVAIDGRSLGRPNRAEGDRDWRLPASRVSVGPGLHEITVTGTGPRGTDVKSVRILHEPSVAFDLRMSPDGAAYDVGAIPRDPPDPEVLLFGPAGEDDVRLTLTVAGPPEVDAAITTLERDTGSTLSLIVNRIQPTVGVHEVVVTATAGTQQRQAVYTITVAGDEGTQGASTTQPSGGNTMAFDDFEAGNQWQATVTRTTNGATAAADVTAGGGNPGGFHEMTHVLPGTDEGEANPTQIVVLHSYTGAEVDPAIAGPFVRIRYSEDQIVLDPPFEGAAVGALFVVTQNGTIFTAPINENNAFRNTEWQAISVDLVPGDFSPAPGPDLSVTGGAMTFGILRSNTNRSAAEIVVRHGIDNWTVTLLQQ